MVDLSKNKYTELLVLIILFLLTLALIDQRGIRSLIASFFFLCVIISFVKRTRLSKKGFTIYVGGAILGFLFEVVASLKLFPQFESFFYIVGNLIYAIFLFIAIVSIGGRLFAEESVKIDTIRGGFCIYLFMGSLWFLLYQSISLLDPKAFFYAVERKGMYQLVYYSFTTLTTLGYGDIVPLNRVAMSLSNLEAIVGLLYPAVFIAKLVSLYSIREVEKDEL